MIRFILALTLISVSLSAFADEPIPKELTPEQKAAALRAAETIGFAIYRHDRAAAIASDAAIALPQFKNDSRIRGWVTEEQQGQITVTFIDETPAALYRITVSKEGVAGPVSALDSPAPLTTYEAGAAAARSAALSSRFQQCSNSYNSVVLPSSGAPGSNWLVYLLPGTTKNNVVPIGGTYRVEVSGSKVVSQRGFTRSCIALQTDPKAVGLMISHVMDPAPTEAHVFWSIWARKPMYVAIPSNGTVWLVAGNKIELIEQKATEG
ncbi:hypothetical protein RF679_06065 [Undibacterium cyanobacteriorum]|uniref:Uncharacterized protein n=1 Tax=Undibacterium cyanobacteriorum TaxID=3073561 RepID=A0ABY9RKU6_9BURK|nr:hypothetical protein [Undibacterium sp. 20NA77.5]WMW81846.1 hypothetical protein RF679_06065 [Undibacterium sp. 20NA77.5]